MPDQTLAARVRTKYPGVYDDMSDTDLEAKVKAKHPGAYDDIPTSDAAQDTPVVKSDGSGAMLAGGSLAGLAAAIPLARRAAEQVATSPMIGRAASAASRWAAPANVAMEVANVATGRKSLPQAAWGAAKGEAMRQGGKLAFRAAAPVASTLGAEGVAGMAAPLAVPIAGGLAGLAIPAGFLGALQHDANRKVDIDYTKHAPVTDIAKVFMNMMNSEKNRGRTLDERQDDPNDVMFKPDDSAAVTAIVNKLRGTP